MTTRRAVIQLAAATMALACATSHAATASRAPPWAMEFMARWYAYYNAGDAHGLSGMFAPDARFGLDHGRSAIAASMAADFLNTQYVCAGAYEGVRELEDMAVAWGHESCLETTRADHKSVRTHERWLLVFRRQPDGTWQLSEETFAAVDAPGGVP